MRILCLAIGFALTAQYAGAQCTGPSLLDDLSAEARQGIMDRADAVPYGSGLFWELSRGEDTITLAGTLHINDPRLTPLRDALLPALGTADVLLTEITPAEESEMLEALSTDRSIAFITEGPTLVEQLSPEMWEDVSAALLARQTPPFFGAQMQPWYLGLVLSLPPCAIPSMASGERGLDHMLMVEAEALDIPNLPLEGWEGLLDLLRSGDPQEHLDLLEMAVTMDVYANPSTVALMDYYFAGEVARGWELGRATVDLMPMDPEEALALFAELEDMLLVQRNRNWMPVIAETTALHDNVFIAVGAAHLPGETGLLRLLENEGWSVSQLSSP